MANNLQKHYNDFGGLDTRHNKLISDPGSFEGGSRNFRYNFKDELQQFNGFQHKDDDSGASKRGLIEYKYKDINTGASLTQILGVGDDGQLRKKVAHYLKFTAIGAATGFSFYYDELSDNFIFSMIGISDISVNTTMTMAQLATALDALVGVNCIVVDDSGATVVGSTKLAYLGDCVINQSLAVNDVVHSSWFWEVVYYGGTGVPFPTTFLYAATPDAYPNYEGISSTNLNNSVYITDGGFPMKYDGFSVYRAGMPRWTLDLWPSGATFITYPGSGSLGSGIYKYMLQFGFVDPNGLEVLGKIIEGESVSVATAANAAIDVPIYQIGNTALTENTAFPIYSCTVSGLQVFAGTGSKVLTVLSGHNVAVGMCLRLPISNLYSGTAPVRGISFGYFEVTAVSATTITFNKTFDGFQLLQYNPVDVAFYVDQASGGGVNSFQDSIIINACYVPDFIKGKITEAETTGNQLIQDWSPAPVYGPFCRIWRTQVDGDTFYKLIDAPVNMSQQFGIYDTLADSTLTSSEVQALTTIDVDYNIGEEVPRACKYLSSWQNQLVQAGRPVIPDRFLGVPYPYYGGTAPTTGAKWGFSIELAPWAYGENNLCDFQSIYWADTNAPEGFPQSGLNEESLDTVFNDEVKGIAPNKDAFFIFKQRSMGFLTGSPALGQINKEVIEADVGCASHRTIAEVRGALMWLDGTNGFYSCVAGRLPVAIGWPVSDTVKLNPDKLDFSKAVAANFRLDDMYICAIEDQTFVYDYAETDKGTIRNCWYFCDRFNTTAILATADDELIICVDDQLWKYKRTNTKYDFTDHKSAIEFEVRSAFINFKEPIIDKSYIGLWINSVQGDFTLSIDEYANYLDTQISSQDVDFAAESDKLTVKVNAKISTAKVSAVSVGMRNNQKNKFVRIQGWELQFAPDFDRGEGKK